MKNSIINYNDEYEINTELVKTLDSGVVIFKAVVKSNKVNSRGKYKTTMAHSSGYISGQTSVNDIELEAINRAISLI